MSATVGSRRPSTRRREPRGGSLLRAELHRFRSRRFIQVLLVLARARLGRRHRHRADPVRRSRRPTTGADAQQQVDQIVAEQRAVPAAVPGRPGTRRPTTVAGGRLRAAADRARTSALEDFLGKAPFDFADAGHGGRPRLRRRSPPSLAFLIGATWIGAEWSTRSMVALLFWVPQRMRVMGTKLAVLVGGAAAARGRGAGRLAGDGRDPARRRRHGDAAARRVLGRPAADPGPRRAAHRPRRRCSAFGLTNLVRNTGAALGIGFVYFVDRGDAVRALRPTWQPWLLSDNAVGAGPGRRADDLYLRRTVPDPTGFVRADRVLPRPPAVRASSWAPSPR